MEEIILTSQSPEETTMLGERIAILLKPGDILCLFGELGSGKTTFVKGLAKGLKIKSEKVSSPTFVLMNIYEGRIPLYHYDLYRLENEDEIRGLGSDEFFYGKGVSVVEWADKLGSFTPKEYLEVRLSHRKEGTRNIALLGIGKRYQELFRRIIKIA